MQSPIVIHLHIILDDEWYDSIPETLFEEDQPSYTTVSILKRMNLLKAIMKIQQIVEGHCFQISIV